MVDEMLVDSLVSGDQNYQVMKLSWTFKEIWSDSEYYEI